MAKQSLRYILLALFSLVLLVVARAQSTDTEATEKPKKTGKVPPPPVNSHWLDTRRTVDTLSLAERFALRTSTTDWLLLIPNIGVEFDVKNKTWNRWTVGFNVRGNWQTSHTYKPSMVYNLFEVRAEGRQYWRARQIRQGYIDKHRHLWDKAVSIRRTRVKHPTTTWYRGLYAGYTNYSIKFGKKGHQGQGIIAGISYGFVRPMYAFANGNSLDLEVGISGGAMYAKDTEYTHDAESDCYPVLKENDWALVKFPVVTDLRLGLIYRLGHHPVTSKYRYRRDVDTRYDDRKTTHTRETLKNRQDKSSYKERHYKILREFWHVYDSIAGADHSKMLEERKQKAQEQLRNKADSKKAEAERRQQDKQQAKQDKAQAREQKEQQKLAEKNAKQAEKDAKQAEKDAKQAEKNDKQGKKKGKEAAHEN